MILCKKVFIFRSIHLIILNSLLREDLIKLDNKCTIYYIPQFVNIDFFKYTYKRNKSIILRKFKDPIWSRNLNLFIVFIYIFRIFIPKKSNYILTFHEISYQFICNILRYNYILCEEGNGFQWYRNNRSMLNLLSIKYYLGGRFALKCFRFTKNNISINDQFVNNRSCLIANEVKNNKSDYSSFDVFPETELIWLVQSPVNCCKINNEIFNYLHKKYKNIVFKLHPNTCRNCRSNLTSITDRILQGDIPIELYDLSPEVSVYSLFSSANNCSLLNNDQYNGDTILLSIDEIKQKLYKKL